MLYLLGLVHFMLALGEGSSFGSTFRGDVNKLVCRVMGENSQDHGCSGGQSKTTGAKTWTGLATE